MSPEELGTNAKCSKFVLSELESCLPAILSEGTCQSELMGETRTLFPLSTTSALLKMGCYGTPLPWCFGTLSYMLV